MTTFFNRHDVDPMNALQEAAERCDKICDDFAARIHESEKVCVIDVGEAGGSHEDAVYFSDQLKKRGCKTFVQDAKIYAWGKAFEKAMEREALKPIPIQPLPVDPEVEKLMWMWYGSFY